MNWSSWLDNNSKKFVSHKIINIMEHGATVWMLFFYVESNESAT